MNKIRLHINVDHIATLRQQRGTKYPDPVTAAALCELAGADGITIHLREDRRHIQDRDLRLIRQTVQTVLNLEMAATTEMVEIACSVKPDFVTLVPEKREEKTTEGGLALDNPNTYSNINTAVVKLQKAGIPVSLFIDPDSRIVELAKKLQAQIIELHTGDYTLAENKEDEETELDRLFEAAEKAKELDLKLAAGHGLDYTNVQGILDLPELQELNIGHSIISRAALTGLENAVKDMIIHIES
ncbi:MAG: pyridoxine 5'-phosphate synthase [Myxococcota bacterium]